MSSEDILWEGDGMNDTKNVPLVKVSLEIMGEGPIGAVIDELTVIQADHPDAKVHVNWDGQAIVTYWKLGSG